jgi:hypothetical protein
MGLPGLVLRASAVLSARSSTGLIPIKATDSVSLRWTDPDAVRSGRLHCLGQRPFRVSHCRGHATLWTGRSRTRSVDRDPCTRRSSNGSLGVTPFLAVTRCPDTSPVRGGQSSGDAPTGQKDHAALNTDLGTIGSSVTKPRSRSRRI